MYEPLVSIIIPVYNGANYLEEALKSAIEQSYKNIEIIVIDDGSTDNGETKKIADKFKNRIKFYQKENGGVSSALNYGIRVMQGEWFSWLSHDDIYKPNKIELQINRLQEILITETIENLYKHVLYSNSELIDRNGRIIPNPQKRLNKIESTNLEIILNNIKRNDLMGCTFLLHRECFTKEGLFNENLRAVQDFDFWYRLLFNEYTFEYLPEKLVYFRVHGAQVTYKIPDRIYKEQNLFYNSVLDNFCNLAIYKNFSNLNTLGNTLLVRGEFIDISKKAFLLADTMNKSRLSFFRKPQRFFLWFWGKSRLVIKKSYLAYRLKRIDTIKH